MDEESSVSIGERLRSIRRQKGLSLHDVEASSRQEFKASVLGAYERGERAISVARLLRLSEIYDVPADQLLPRTAGEVEIDLTESRDLESVTIDLGRLTKLDDPELAALGRYVARIQLERQDFNGRMITLRRDDVRVLAAVFGWRPEDVGDRLADVGLRAGT